VKVFTPSSTCYVVCESLHLLYGIGVDVWCACGEYYLQVSCMWRERFCLHMISPYQPYVIVRRM
jgi:hypothetical protein